MKINKLKINSFGKLKDKEINLKNNINIVYGKNESGKSTLVKFITNSFYGTSKNKKGKDLSDFEKYKPWDTEEFSGKIEYELDNKNKYEVFREFGKKNPRIYNEKSEDISKEFNIDKNKGNEFFYEQTKIDEELFLSTLIINQKEIKLEKNDQNYLIQKIANLVGTGEDNVSYKRAIDRLNRKQLDEIGTERSREKPINLISEKLRIIEIEKQNLEENAKNKVEIDKKIEQNMEEISNNEKLIELMKEIKKISDEEILENEKLKIKEEIKNKEKERINILNEEIKKIKNDNKNELDKKDSKNKNNLLFIFIIIFLIILNIIEFIFIKNNITKIISLLLIPISIITYLILKTKKSKQNKIKNNIYKKINNLENEIKIIEKNAENLEIENKKHNNKIENDIQNKKEKIEIAYFQLNNLENDFAEKNKINNLINSNNINFEIENIQNNINKNKIELNTLKFKQENLDKDLEKLSEIEENKIIFLQQYVNLTRKNESINLAKEILNRAYEKMKNSVTPRFTNNLSEIISKITDGKYTKILYNENDGLVTELKNGNYVPIDRLSEGTIDQLYLSLRLSMAEELSEEKIPIILDEAFAFYDTQRLENILKFIYDNFKNRQIIIMTCTNREKEILNKLNIEFNFVEL